MQDQRRQADAERPCVVDESKVEARGSLQKAGLPSPAALQVGQRKETEEHKQILLF